MVFFRILIPLSSLSRVSDSLRGHLMLGNCKKENICPDHFPDFNLGSFIIIKSMFIMKNLTDFRKTVETGVNPHLEKVNKPRASKEQIGWGARELLGAGGG